jgi:ABC-type enterochelin transport system substrate-binding protein
MSRLALVAVACLVVLTGCQSGGSPACPAIGPDGERVDDSVCPEERAGGLSLSLERDADTVRVTATNVGDEAVPVNPDRWVVFRNAAARRADAPEWETAANAPAGTHNLTVRELAPGETETWEVRYDPTAPDASDRRDAVLRRSGEYAFSLGASDRTYVVPFEIED